MKTDRFQGEVNVVRDVLVALRCHVTESRPKAGAKAKSKAKAKEAGVCVCVLPLNMFVAPFLGITKVARK